MSSTPFFVSHWQIGIARVTKSLCTKDHLLPTITLKIYHTSLPVGRIIGITMKECQWEGTKSSVSWSLGNLADKKNVSVSFPNYRNALHITTLFRAMQYIHNIS